MSDWAAVVLVLGLCGLAVAVYGVQALVGVRNAALDLGSLRAAVDLQARNVEGIDARLKKAENMLKLDGAAIMREAAKKSVPAFMKGPGEA